MDSIRYDDLKMWTGRVVTSVAESRPVSYQLTRIYPNPFSDRTNIEVALAEVSEVSYAIYNSLGQVVFEQPPQLLAPGKQILTWNPEPVLASGVYFYSLLVRSATAVRIENRTMLKLR